MAAANDPVCTHYRVAGHDVGNIVVGVDDVASFSGWFGCNGGANTTGIQFPKGSGVDYGFISLAVGGIRSKDSLVTAYNPPWGWIGYEFITTQCEWEEHITQRLRSNPCYRDVLADSTQSDQDITASYEDTITTRAPYPAVDEFEGRSHLPLGIGVTQKSYAWSSGSAADFVIVEYSLRNVGIPSDPDWNEARGTLRDVYVALFLEPRASYYVDPFSGYDDNLVEFIGASPSPLRPEINEAFNLMMAYDNDGDPSVSGFDRKSATGALGVAVLKRPTATSSIAFNWWVGGDPTKNWGPVKRTSQVTFLHGGLGSVQGDRAFYQLLSNGEMDYSQVEAAIDHQARGWLPSNTNPGWAADIANGQAVTAIVSMGPFDLPRDSSVAIAIGVVGGSDLHFDPNNFRDFFDPLRPEIYSSRLDRTDLLKNTQWAKWTYDNPGIDTDGDGYAGEWFLRGGDTVYYRGDRIPDLRAALPPRTPPLEFQNRAGRIAIRWNGDRTETEEDVFTQRPDFEGYRIYMSRTGREEEWSFVTQRDLANFTRFTWNEARDRWETNDPPYSVDSLKRIYDALTDSSYGFPFHPDSFPVPILDRALLEVQFDPDFPEKLDSVYRYFAPYEANNQPDDVGLAMAVELGADVTGVIRKLFPQAAPMDTAYRDDGTPYLPFYEYEYVVTDLQVAEPVFLSVTAFDHGDPASGLEPLESSKSISAQEVWPINSSQVVASERPKPGVYPNPYRLIDAYYDNNWENRRGLEPDRERARQVTFYNVPDTCVLSIYTLDGDLVKRLHHSTNPSSSEATVVRWDLITRNTQAVKTGIYIWSVESRFGTDVGKLVIIK